MKIFKETSYDIVRLYVNQLGIMIFSMLLYTAVGSFESDKLSSGLSIFVSLFSICFYLVLIYYVIWEIGAKDKIRIDGGRAEPCKYKGLVMGLFANIPNFVLGIFTVLFMVIYLITGNEVVFSLFFVFNLIIRIHASMYMGIITALVPSRAPAGSSDIDQIEFLIEAILFTVIPLVSVAVTHLAYQLGSKDKKILSIFSNK